MDRFVLTDAQWAKVEPHCLGKPRDPGRSGSDNRRLVEAMLWVVRTGSPWRDLPACFGNWNTVFKQYRDWVKADVFVRLFEACSDKPDMEYAMVDAHGQGSPPWPRRKRGTQRQAIGRWKGGMTTKVLALTDALGNLVRFELLPGHRFDTVGISPLRDSIAFNALIADLDARGAKAVVAPHPRRVQPRPLGTEIYKWHHLIENVFGKLKEFKRIATRGDKTDTSFAAIIHLAAAVINSG